MEKSEYKELEITCNDKKLKEYQNTNAINEVFGCIIKNPKLVSDTRYNLRREDFVTKFHQIIFVTIHDMLEAEYNTININSINKYLEDYPRDKKYYDQIDGDTFLANAAYTCDEDNFNANYDIVKKYSLIRDLVRIGIDVREFCDPDDLDEDRTAKRNKRIKETPINEIVSYYRGKILDIGDTYLSDKEDQIVKAGNDEFMELIDKWQAYKNIGPGFSCDMLTTLTDGMREGRFMLGSAGSGTGKTRLALSTIAHTFASKYYDSASKEWKTTQTGGKYPCLYIGTEMEINEEIMPLIAAYMADVPSNKILKGEINKEERDRIAKANKYLKEESNIYLIYMPDYNLAKLENVITSHVLLKGVRYVFFDYIHPTSELISEYVKASSLPNVREDQVLANVGLKLKNLAKDLNIFIHAATQTSGTEKYIRENRDYSCIRGAKSLADKADICYIVTKVKQGDGEEWKKLNEVRRIMINSQTERNPNLCLTVYKNRSGYSDRMLWVRFEYATLRMHDCFATDKDYSLDKVDQTRVVVNDKGEVVYLYEKDLNIDRKLIEEEAEKKRLEEEAELLNQNKIKQKAVNIPPLVMERKGAIIESTEFTCKDEEEAEERLKKNEVPEEDFEEEESFNEEDFEEEEKELEAGYAMEDLSEYATDEF